MREDELGHTKKTNHPLLPKKSHATTRELIHKKERKKQLTERPLEVGPHRVEAHEAEDDGEETSATKYRRQDSVHYDNPR